MHLKPALSWCDEVYLAPVKIVHVASVMSSAVTAMDLVIITNGFPPTTGEITQIPNWWW